MSKKYIAMISGGRDSTAMVEVDTIYLDFINKRRKQ